MGLYVLAPYTNLFKVSQSNILFHYFYITSNVVIPSLFTMYKRVLNRIVCDT